METDNRFRIAVDIGNKTLLEKLEGVEVDAVLISHIHGDHFSIDQINKISPRNIYMNQECIDAVGEGAITAGIHRIKDGETVDVGGIEILPFNVDHGPNVSSPLAENFGFIIKVDGKTVYFAGDMFYESGVDVDALEVDIALIPVGTFYTFGPEEAYSFVKKFKKIDKIVSMHYEKMPETKTQFLELTKSLFNAE